MEQLKEILIDEKNQMLIRDLVRTINELQGRLQLIIRLLDGCWWCCYLTNSSWPEDREMDILFEKPKDRENIKSRNGKFSEIYW